MKIAKFGSSLIFPKSQFHTLASVSSYVMAITKTFEIKWQKQYGTRNLQRYCSKVCMTHRSKLGGGTAPQKEIWRGAQNCHLPEWCVGWGCIFCCLLPWDTDSDGRAFVWFSVATSIQGAFTALYRSITGGIAWLCIVLSDFQMVCMTWWQCQPKLYDVQV